ncbi:MAG TPA: tetratricopeptide repeat protein [Kiritimatiellia bacterium]|nr:tetratricopeptide repeat protein [Kiritimatiellia bacterium]HMP33737.1 tetratricopeptide repeat protein [Kiritimatiellia bacterium]
MHPSHPSRHHRSLTDLKRAAWSVLLVAWFAQPLHAGDGYRLMYVKTDDPAVTYVDLARIERQLAEAREALAASTEPRQLAELTARIHRLERQLAREQADIAALRDDLNQQKLAWHAERETLQDAYDTLQDAHTGLLADLERKQRQIDRNLAAATSWEHERAELRRQLHRESLVRNGKSLRQTLDTLDSAALVSSLNDVGLLLQAEGRLPEAEELFRRALVVLDATVGRDDVATGTILEHLADTSMRRGNPDAALAFYREAAEVFGARLGTTHPRYANTLNNLGNVQRERGDFSEAERLYRETVRIYATHGKRHQVARAVAAHNLGVLMMGLGRMDDAGPLLEQAADLLTRQRGSASNQAIMACQSLSEFYRITGQPDRADHFQNLARDLAFNQFIP